MVCPCTLWAVAANANLRGNWYAVAFTADNVVATAVATKCDGGDENDDIIGRSEC